MGPFCSRWMRVGLLLALALVSCGRPQPASLPATADTRPSPAPPAISPALAPTEAFPNEASTIAYPTPRAAPGSYPFGTATIPPPTLPIMPEAYPAPPPSSPTSAPEPPVAPDPLDAVAASFAPPVGESYQGSAVADSAEVYDLATNTWALTGGIPAGRYAPQVIALASGKILLVGGESPGSFCPNGLGSADVYDPATGRWTPTSRVRRPRLNPAVASLADGRALVAGGFWNGDADTPGLRTLASAELYDPAGNTWRLTGAMTAERAAPGTAVLADGRVLVAGGWRSTNPSGSANETLSSAELYDPTTGTWSPTGALAVGRILPTLIPLPDGGALAVGGSDGGPTTPRASVERFDPATGMWSTVREAGSAPAVSTGTRLADGRVLVVDMPPLGLSITHKLIGHADARPSPAPTTRSPRCRPGERAHARSS